MGPPGMQGQSGGMGPPGMQGPPMGMRWRGPPPRGMPPPFGERNIFCLSTYDRYVVGTEYYFN